jgi:hypothetical protein
MAPDFERLVLQKGHPCLAVNSSEFCPSIGQTHIDDADRFDAGPRRLRAE